MNTRRFLSVLVAVAAALTMTAQTAREDLQANKYLAGGNYLDYDRVLPTEQLTPAPKGYTPFYMSHYGRHGSRWLIAKDAYTSVTDPLSEARKAGVLTAVGEETLQQLERFLPTTVKRLGDLSTVGERQHHGIARRMVQNFPEIFRSKNLLIDARSTTVNRCILSMAAECEELAAANPTARIHNDVSESLQYYLNQPREGIVETNGIKGRKLRQAFNHRIHTDRMMQSLFTDTVWVRQHVDAWKLMFNLFEVTTNMQSHDDGCDLYHLFTDDELYEQWSVRNAGWYLNYAAAPMTESMMPFSQRNLLRNIIETVDTVTVTQATLRFGHEVCVMPLTCLLELGDFAVKVNDLNQLDDQWRNYRIFPMASNVQLIFYRPTKGKGDILVKAMLNEREMTLPIATKQYPYYSWKDLRSYYLEKLDKFDALDRQHRENSGKQ